MENPAGQLQEKLHKLYGVTFKKEVVVKKREYAPNEVTVKLLLPNGSVYKATGRSTKIASKKVSVLALKYEGLI